MKRIARLTGFFFIFFLFVAGWSMGETVAEPTDSLPPMMKWTVQKAWPVEKTAKKQHIKFTCEFTNVLEKDIINLSSLQVEVSGVAGERRETYRRSVEVGMDFDPPLAPNETKRLDIGFWRKLNPKQNMLPYDTVSIRVLDIVCTPSRALDDDLSENFTMTDIFDWNRYNEKQKRTAVHSLQETLLAKGCLKKKYSDEQLLEAVERELAKDSEQASILEKLSIGLNIDPECAFR